MFAGQVGKTFDTVEACIEYIWKTPHVRWHVLAPLGCMHENHRIALLMHTCVGLHRSGMYSQENHVCYS